MATDRWGREAFKLGDGSVPAATGPAKSMMLDTIQGWAVGLKGTSAEQRRPMSAQTSSRPLRDVLRTSDIEKACPTPQTREVHHPQPPLATESARPTRPSSAYQAAPLVNEEVSAVYKYSSMHHPQWRLNSARSTFRAHHNPVSPQYPQQPQVAIAADTGNRAVADSSAVQHCLRGPSSCSPTRKRVPARAWGTYSIKYLAADEIAVRAGWVGAVETDALPLPSPKIRCYPGLEDEQRLQAAARQAHQGVKKSAASQRQLLESAAVEERRDEQRWFHEAHVLRLANFHAGGSSEPSASPQTSARPSTSGRIGSGRSTNTEKLVEKMSERFQRNVHHKAVAGSQADLYFARLALERTSGPAARSTV